MPDAPRIFLAHASEDKPVMLELYNRLKRQGYCPWLDKMDLIPGQNWRQEIPKVIKSSDIFLACLSSRSTGKQGYVQRELRMALNAYAEKPPGTIFLIPLRLDDCQIPELRQDEYGVNLRDLHWLDYFEPDGFEKLVRAIRYQFPVKPDIEPVPVVSQPQIAQPTVPPVPLKPTYPTFAFELITFNDRGEEIERRHGQAEYYLEDLGGGSILDRVRIPGLEGGITLNMVLIPGGTFMMGSPEHEEERHEDESPQHQVTVPEFWIGRFQITQAQWQVVAALPKVERDLASDPSLFKGDRRPVERVSWHDVQEFCARLTRHTGRCYRLPSESEWEYACRANTTTAYSFGNSFSEKAANYNPVVGETSVVGHYPPNGFGLHDMHGNVWEWCLDDWHDNYDKAPDDGTAWITDSSSAKKVRRGGSWDCDPRHSRSAYRFGNETFFCDDNTGFRVCCSSPKA